MLMQRQVLGPSQHVDRQCTPPMRGALKQRSTLRCTQCIARASRHTAVCSAAVSDAIASVGHLSPSVEASIEAALPHCLRGTDLGVGARTVGKVRDTYDCGDVLVIVTTDRQSAFDRMLAAVPFKGQVLNQTSAWWMQHTKHIAPNALLSLPDPNISVMRKCSVFPVEFVVRGYMTGSTDTSLWTHYSAGARQYCGHSLPDGMRKNDRLQAAIVTPTTKAADHDVPVSAAQVVEQGLMSAEDWEHASRAALELFAFGQEQAASRGLLLVDTKYEFGRGPDGSILLVDEIHTPDSSRYWLASGFQERHAAGQEPQSIDKEFLRLWFRKRCDPYNDEFLPEAPAELVSELSRRYITLYQTITGQPFQPAPVDESRQLRMTAAVMQALEEVKG